MASWFLELNKVYFAL